MHLTAIGKLLYAVNYDVDSIYGDVMQTTKILLDKREHNDKKHLKKSIEKAKSKSLEMFSQ